MKKVKLAIIILLTLFGVYNLYSLIILGKAINTIKIIQNSSQKNNLIFEEKTSEFKQYVYKTMKKKFPVSVTFLIAYIKIKPITGEYPWTAEQIVSENDLNKYSLEELSLIRNEIFARHNWAFPEGDIKKYFEKFNWYKPSKNIKNKNHYNSEILKKISEIEMSNAKIILAYEKFRKELEEYRN